MERLQLAHEEQRMRFRRQFRDADATILFYEQRPADADKAAAKVQDLSGDKFKAKAGTQTYTERVKWGEMLLGIARTWPPSRSPRRPSARSAASRCAWCRTPRRARRTPGT